MADHSYLVQAAARNLEEKGRMLDVLCARCTHGVVYRRVKALEPVAFCTEIKGAVPTDIAERSSFEDTRAIPMYEMQEIAIPVDARVGTSDGAYA